MYDLYKSKLNFKSFEISRWVFYVSRALNLSNLLQIFGHSPPPEKYTFFSFWGKKFPLKLKKKKLIRCVSWLLYLNSTSI